MMRTANQPNNPANNAVEVVNENLFFSIQTAEVAKSVALINVVALQ